MPPLKLYFKWGIKFGEPYALADKGARAVSYLEREKLFRRIERKYPQKKETAEDFEFPEISGEKKMIRTG